MTANIEQNFARTFSNADGAAVLAHLRRITVERALHPNATDAELRHIEGQRALVHMIETLITRGKNT